MRLVCQWVLLRAARHVERLRLRVELDHQQLDAAAELETALVAMLVGCGAAGRLSELDLSLVHVPFGLSSWLSALRSLQKLQISAMASLQGLGAECRLVAAGPLHTLTDLEVLWLSGYPIVAMSDVTELASLRRLTMDDVEMASLPLEGLSILEYLFLSRSGYLPDSLALPASLETLRINGVSTSSMVALHAAMRQATQLTCLLLQGISSLTGLPLELACLERLQDFGWEVSPELNDYGLRQLPAGPWLNSVTRLVLPALKAETG
ncbi:hypothetical protein CHLNCDRAFT_132995 [Chlorella variabilis]|uniref:Uncharacterized protein n=1 Tax=Chlorella variabilis TaxID=554065 RepID=E1Z242_CHLVA|nr:hypothetical protein CHLNCDRAFT_132995 [Chlorella variabilis]EFN59930.1 hypothetical protein CHLNCDRAFT_132995 [Chlorella variabilis]|eukprot:XP_005852032.1 hypothetical protein CHLNCDRAFT_132995 [Chlorella variabilis]